MSLDGMMVHRATVYRRRAGVDAYGQPHKAREDFTVVRTGLRGRLTHGSGSQSNTDADTDVVNDDYRFVFEPGYAMKEVDRLKVQDAAGNVIMDDADVTHVRIVTDGRGIEHHREAALSVMRRADL